MTDHETVTLHRYPDGTLDLDRITAEGYARDAYHAASAALRLVAATRRRWGMAGSAYTISHRHPVHPDATVDSARDVTTRWLQNVVDAELHLKACQGYVNDYGDVTPRPRVVPPPSDLVFTGSVPGLRTYRIQTAETHEPAPIEHGDHWDRWPSRPGDDT